MSFFSTHFKKEKLMPRKTRMAGFAFLYAALVASIVMTIGLGLLGLTLKQEILSSTGRESIFAFYSADAGAECALYWDMQASGNPPSIFATSSTDILVPAPGSGAFCVGQDITSVWNITTSPSAATTTFALNLSGGRCVALTVAKFHNGLKTTIESRGYNDGAVAGTLCTSSNPKRTERAIRVIY